jgi:uncharacterized protein (TIGR02246 family)
MTFRETLRKHLQAIQDRDLKALADTVAEDSLVLIMADGKLARSTAEFLEAHRGWFAMHGWTLQASQVEVFESADLGIAVLRLDYREPPATHSRSYLTLAFQKQNGRWVMVQDQNTPIK